MRSERKIGPTTAVALLLMAAALAAAAPGAAGKGMFWNGYGLGWVDASAREVTVPGDPYRYTAVSPRVAERQTVVTRTDRAGGRVSRWWHLPGAWLFPALAYDATPGGLSADGGTLVLHRFAPFHRPHRTALAILDADAPRPRGARRISLRGDYGLDAISPHGGRIYLRHYLPRSRNRGAVHSLPFEIRALDAGSGRLLPGPIVASNAPEEPTRGTPISQANGRDGRAYTLFDGDAAAGESTRRAPFVLALDPAAGTAFRLDLPGLGAGHGLFALGLRLADHDRRLEIVDQGGRRNYPGETVVSVDTARLESREPVATASNGRIGRSREGRPIRLRQSGDPAIAGRLLVFGCIHGDECGVARDLVPLADGRPDPDVNVLVVPELDPDGTAAGSRLNAAGVDLNRNFPSGWRPIGRPGDPQYSGPHPFSEPETRLAARLIDALEPEVTIWFHEHHAPRPLVRAWGPSLSAARRFAASAGLPFRAIPWPDGTAPNWQNHRFPGTASFVVELPRADPGAVSESRLDRAIDRTAREAARD